MTGEDDTEEIEEVGAESVAGTSSTNNAQMRKRVGRPAKALPILRNQPAIYRFFGRFDEPAEDRDEEDIDIAEEIDEEVVNNAAQKGDSNESETIEDSSSESNDSFSVDVDVEAQLQFEEEIRRFDEGESPVRKKHRMREETNVDGMEESDTELPEIGKYDVVSEYNTSSLTKIMETRIQGNNVMRMQTKSKEKKGINWLEQEDSEEQSGAEYSTVDVNHNNGKITMILKRQ